MAYPQCFTCLFYLGLISMTQVSAVPIAVYKFSLENRENEFITVQPNTPNNTTAGYTVCMRAMFWTLSNIVLFQSSSQLLGISYTANSALFKNYLYEKMFPLSSLSLSSSEWNAFCVVYNHTNYLLIITINGVQCLKESIEDSIGDRMIRNLGALLTIGGTKRSNRFSGQISDFNFWNIPLSPEEVEKFTFGFEEDFFENSYPKFVRWSNVNVTSVGGNNKTIFIPQELLWSSSSSNSLILYPMRKDFEQSSSICTSLNGELFNENMTNSETLFLKRELVNASLGCKTHIWVNKSTDNDTSNDNDINLFEVKQSLISKNCTYFDNTEIKFKNDSCFETKCFACKLPSNRTIFKVQNDWKEKIINDKEYLLVNNEEKIIFAGITGQTFISGSDNWSILSYWPGQKSEMKKLAKIDGMAQLPIGIKSFIPVEGLQNEGRSFQLKLTNVT